MKKLFLIVCCLVGSSTQSAHAMQALVPAMRAALPAIQCGVIWGAGLPFAAGSCGMIASKKTNMSIIKENSYCVLQGALFGGLSGIVVHVIAKLFANPSTLALNLANGFGACVGCYGIYNLLLYKRRVYQEKV